MWIAIHEPRTRDEIQAVFEELRRREPTTSDCTYNVWLRQAWLRLPNLAPATRTVLSHELLTLSASSQAPSPSVPIESPIHQPTNWRVTAKAWAIALSGVVAAQIWPDALGNCWLLPVMTTFGLGFWFWSRSVRPRTTARV